MAQVGIHEAKTHLSRLLRRVAAGEVIVIAKGGTPLARLVPIHSRSRRDLGRDKGVVALHDDFDGPCPRARGGREPAARYPVLVVDAGLTGKILCPGAGYPR